MDDASARHVRAWLKKSASDLRTAELLAGLPGGPGDTAIYHCQQAAEKAAKAFLLAHEIEFEKIHDIRLLIAQAVEADATLEILRDAADELTPYAVIYRYPVDMEATDPTPAELQSALKSAALVCRTIEARLSIFLQD